MIDFELDEAVHGLWETYGKVNPSRFHGKFDKVPDFVSRQAQRISARHGQGQCAANEAMRRELIELAQEGAEIFPELAELILSMAGKVKELGPDRQGVVLFVMAAVSKAYAGNLEPCGRFLLQVALILTGLLENEAIVCLRESTSTAALSITTGKSN